MIVYWKYTLKPDSDEYFVFKRNTSTKEEICVIDTTGDRIQSCWDEWDYDNIQRERKKISQYNIKQLSKEKLFLELI